MDEAALFLEPPFTFPALPVAESEIVVVGTIGAAQALLSENKRNVFSEFTLIVEDVFKSNIPGVAQGSVLTIDRVGGHVKYPNGQRVLFRIARLNIPQTGGRYLLFLTSIHNKEDISILIGYQLTPNGAFRSTRLIRLPALRVLPRSNFSKECGTCERLDQIHVQQICYLFTRGQTREPGGNTITSHSACSRR